MEKIMIKDLLAKQKVICNALEKLDEKCFNMKISPFSVNIIDNFALIEEPIVFKNSEMNINEKRKQFKKIVKEIGNEYNLDSNWLNDDLSFAYKSLKELELFIGKLTFYTKMNMSTIIVNVLDFTDTIRMKIINLDTAIDKYKVVNERYKVLEEDFTNIDNNQENNKEYIELKNSIISNNEEFENIKNSLVDEIVDYMKYDDFNINNLDKYLKKYTVNPKYIYNIIISNY